MGTRLPVEVNTHVAGTLEFASGAIASVITSFDVWGHHLPMLEIHGEDASMSVGDPNFFHGVNHVLKGGTRDWVEIPHSHTINIGRGAGVADMAYAIQSGRPHRVSGDLAFHVLDIMCALEEGQRIGGAGPAAWGVGCWRARSSSRSRCRYNRAWPMMGRTRWMFGFRKAQPHPP